MYYGEGRLTGNLGTYIVDGGRDAWDAERLIRNATATKEQVHLPKLVKASASKKEDLYNSLEADPTRRHGVYSLGYNVYFLEFAFFG